VFQELDSLIPPGFSGAAGRTKPWGTAHALLCAVEKIDAPFGVLNADDFYGREAFAVLGKYLSGGRSTAEGAIVPFSLKKTLSPQGTVTRGVCDIQRGYLSSVDELTAIAREADGRIFNAPAGGERRELPEDTPVSMNFWGFPQEVFPDLRRYFDDFLKTKGGEPKSECYLPLWADWLIKNGLLKIRSLEADSEWFGVTYKEDREMAVNRIKKLVSEGVYPASLWGSRP
jgi:hypothetical protein